MSTDMQTHHKKRPCSECGELLHFRNEGRKEFFCPKCGLVDTFYFDASKIFFAIQSQRRAVKRSIGKEILANHQRFPVLIEEDYWLVYDFGYYGKVFIDTAKKEYDFIDKFGNANRFMDVANLVEFFSNRASNIRMHSDSQRWTDRGNSGKEVETL